MHSISLEARWDPQSSREMVIPLGARIPAGVLSFRITCQSERRSGFRFFLDFTIVGHARGYRIPITLEWQGEQTIDLPVRALKAFGQPNGWDEITSLRLSSDEALRTGAVIIKSIAFSQSVLPRPINPYEDAIETFFVSSFWHSGDWIVRSNLLPAQYELQSFWFWAQLVLHAPGRGDWVSMERHYPNGIPLAGYESLIALVSFERTATCTIELKVDGAWLTAVQGEPGTQDFQELIADIRNATRLDAIRLHMQCTADDVAILTGVISWVLLQRTGADPLTIRRCGAQQAPPPAARTQSARLEEAGLAAGLYLSRADIPALRRKASTGIGRSMWQKIKAVADQYLGYDPEPHVGQYLPIRRGESLTRRFVEAAPSWENMIPQLGIAYLVSGEDVYGQQLKRVLLAACRCAEWGTAFIDRFPTGVWGYRAPFWPSHMSTTVAVGADMISNLLSDEERAFIDRALIDKGLFWVREYLARNEYCHYMNQGVVFATGGILAAISVEERHPEITPIRQELAAYLYDVLDRYLDEDGATGEGPAYWNYTMSQAIKALVPLSRRAGTSVAEQVTPKLANSISYPLYLRSLAGDGSILLNIGDGGYGNRILSPLLLFFASYLGRPDAMQVWYDQYGHADTAPADAWSFLFYDPQIEPQALDLPLNKRFHGSDRIFWRNGWKPGDILFMFESGRWGPDHYHFDKQQFLLEAYGERMIVDRGMCDYSNPLSLHLHTTASHNTVTVDGQDQSAQSRQPAAQLEHVGKTAHVRYLSSEAGAAYNNLSLFRREVLFVHARYFIIADTIEGIQGKLVWHFHTPLQPQRTSDGFLMTGTRGDLLFILLEPAAWQHTLEMLPLDVDVAADQLSNRLGSTAQSQPGATSVYSDHHLMISPAGQPIDTHLLAILFPLPRGEEHKVKIVRREHTVTVEHAGLCDELDVAAVWKNGLLAALKVGA